MPTHVPDGLCESFDSDNGPPPLGPPDFPASPRTSSLINDSPSIKLLHHLAMQEVRRGNWEYTHEQLEGILAMLYRIYGETAQDGDIAGISRG